MRLINEKCRSLDVLKICFTFLNLIIGMKIRNQFIVFPLRPLTYGLRDLNRVKVTSHANAGSRGHTFVFLFT